MTREQAIEIVKTQYPHDHVMKTALGLLIPELRESEDETTRKELLDFVRSFWADNKEKLPQSSRWVTYLEKQKETPMPNSTELIEMWHKAKAILKEKDFRGDEWRLAQNAFMDGFARGTCVKFEKQEEQKPAWSEEDEKMLARIIERGQSQIQMFETGLLPEHIAWLKSLRPQPHWKPSEEQMDALKELIDDANRAGWVTPGATNLYEQLKKLM